MATSTLDMVKQFEGFTDFVRELGKLHEEYWNSPVTEGKWTIKDIISHIMRWDQYFYNEGINKIRLAQDVTIRHLKFDEFNANAIEYAKTQTNDSIIEQCLEARMKIIDAITDLTEEEYTRKYKDSDDNIFSIRGYLTDFITHDKHHKEQIEAFMKTIQ